MNKTEYPRMKDTEEFISELKIQEPKKHRNVVNKIYRDLDFFVDQLFHTDGKTRRKQITKN